MAVSELEVTCLSAEDVVNELSAKRALTQAEVSPLMEDQVKGAESCMGEAPLYLLGRKHLTVLAASLQIEPLVPVAGNDFREKERTSS